MPIEFTGWDKLSQRLDAVADRLGPKGMDRVVRAGAQVFQEAVEAAAPVLDHRTANSTALDPGALKAGIGTRLRHNAVGTAEARVGPVGKEVRHVARWVEYGHRLVKGGYSKVTAKGTRGPGVEIGEVRAHPFIRPAYESARGAAEEAMIAEVEKLTHGR